MTCAKCGKVVSHYCSGKRNIPERCWEFVDRRGPDECWEWQGRRDPAGYGTLPNGEGRPPTPIRAHRHSYALAFGPIPRGLIVRHTCDNPPCVNPAHLLTGTRTDNAKDRDGRGRNRPTSSPGERNPKALMTDADVLAARAARRGDEKVGVLASRYGVAHTTMRQIVSGLRWRHLPGALPPGGLRAMRPRKETTP